MMVIATPLKLTYQDIESRQGLSLSSNWRIETSRPTVPVQSFNGHHCAFKARWSLLYAEFQVCVPP